MAASLMATNEQLLAEGLRLAIAAAGSRYRLAKELGLTPAAVEQWTAIPVRRVLDVERITGIDRTLLRPDLYRRDPPASSRQRT
jgi:DNA-binding transcriptional regulator YdaS (Cro superfamily)